MLDEVLPPQETEAKRTATIPDIRNFIISLKEIEEAHQAANAGDVGPTASNTLWTSEKPLMYQPIGFDVTGPGAERVRANAIVRRGLPACLFAWAYSPRSSPRGSPTAMLSAGLRSRSAT